MRNETARRDKHDSQARTSRSGRTAASRRASRHSSRRPLRESTSDAAACGAPTARRSAPTAVVRPRACLCKRVSSLAQALHAVIFVGVDSGRFNPTSMEGGVCGYLDAEERRGSYHTRHNPKVRDVHKVPGHHGV